jgi:hypothetical protein
MRAQKALAVTMSAHASSAPTARPSWWLLGPRADLWAFGGSAALGLLIVAVATLSGNLERSAPEWTWVSGVLLIDVAHVWSTAWRTYLVEAELRRFWKRYTLVPLLGYTAGVVLYHVGVMVFWRVLAYLAVYHFVRQQYGWVMLYRARLQEHDAAGRVLDTATIYLATLYPLAWWHLHLPRAFHWFLDGDFWSPGAVPAELVAALVTLMGACWAALLVIYAARAWHAWRRGRPNPGKDLVVATTATCWYVGIVGSNSDLAFTVTNVLAHGIPYMALLHAYTRAAARNGQLAVPRAWTHPMLWVATLWLIAYLEELGWDRAVWHERPWLFGPGFECSWLHPWLVPLLALPQLVHYLLDGAIWRRGEAWLPWRADLEALGPGGSN